ncbi:MULTISPECIES: type II and III secretion system protein family protein [unclassified Caulobacter]|uniref:type II and III secretion system protein family protein n=1 Tax=unclassified Caulobacter TaxID=2648921 RepID=UPI000D367699|nr:MULTISPECIES: type II and III secretion system protein family protein [unclassified Caulobacter]PTS88249.1 pilus assembly protein CpaC [Caulobacter sp. HMWF009]PTT06981.1 pilus assembly protein CpaC [Caulobacter sp. HMWF025]
MTRRFLTAPLAGLFLLGTVAPALADGPVAGSHTYRPPSRVTRPAPPVQMPVSEPDRPLSIDLTAGAGARVLDLPLGKSAIIELPTDVRDMLVTNPLVADAVLRSPRRIYVLGLTAGATDAAFFDASGRRILTLNIRVGQDTSLLSSTLNTVISGGTIKVVPLKDSVILSGLVMNAGDSEKASRIAAQFVSSPEKVLNMLSIAGKDQVQLEVRIVEVQRNIVKQLGVDLNAVLGQLGGDQFTFGISPTYGVNGGLLGGVTSGFKLDTTQQPTMVVPCIGGVTGTCYQVVKDKVFSSFDSAGNPITVVNGDTATLKTTAGSKAINSAKGMIQAFERVGLIRTLAEPNLTVLSGESGTFLAGGEFPVPTGQDTTGKVTIEFKPYGVGLGYTPVVMSGGRISLKLSTEVSELSNLGAYTVSNGSGSSTLTVPGLTVRRAETTVELPSGGSLMIAGLLQQTTKQTVDAIPGMTSMPVLGSLFRSRDFLNGETELVIIITPYIVDPAHPRSLQTPADGLQIAGDMSTALLGRLNKVVKAPAGANIGRAYQGPVGYVIE